jgi:hypothetical protein
MSAQSNGRDGGSSGGGVSISFSYKELIATGLVGAFIAFLVAVWGGSAILVGALSTMVSSVSMAIVKAYLSGAALGGPRLPGLLYILGAIWWFPSPAANGMRQAILLAGLRAGLVSTVISASVVGGTAAAARQVAHKDLPCLVWQIGCNHHIQHKQQPSDRSPDAGRGGPYTGDLDGGKYALVATSLLLGSGILSAAILRRR